MRATIRYVVDWWDGPLSGVADYQGERLYFHYVDDDLTKPGRVFGLYRMTPEGAALEAERHEAWNEACGNYSYDLEPGRTYDWSAEKAAAFYAKYPPNQPAPYAPTASPVVLLHEDAFEYPGGS